MTDEIAIETETSVELDEPTREAVDRYSDASRERADADERQAKARAEILAFLATQDAKVGTIDGAPVIARVTFAQERVDTTRLRVEEPSTFRRFAKLIHVEQLRWRGGRR